MNNSSNLYNQWYSTIYQNQMGGTSWDELKGAIKDASDKLNTNSYPNWTAASALKTKYKAAITSINNSVKELDINDISSKIEKTGNAELLTKQLQDAVNNLTVGAALLDKVSQAVKPQ